MKKIQKKGVEWTLTKIVALVLLIMFLIVMLLFSSQVRDKLLGIISEVFR